MIVILRPAPPNPSPAQPSAGRRIYSRRCDKPGPSRGRSFTRPGAVGTTLRRVIEILTPCPGSRPRSGSPALQAVLTASSGGCGAGQAAAPILLMTLFAMPGCASGALLPAMEARMRRPDAHQVEGGPKGASPKKFRYSSPPRVPRRDAGFSLHPLPFSRHSEGRPNGSRLLVTARRPVESSLPARGLGAAATRLPALGRACAAKRPRPTHGCRIRLDPRLLLPRRSRRCRARASLVPRLDPTALPSPAWGQESLGRASG
jgi:hypothetical protein